MTRSGQRHDIYNSPIQGMGRRLSAFCLAGAAGMLINVPAMAGGNVVWPAGSTQHIISDLLVSDTLTIEEGVTVLANANTTLFIQAGGTLLVNGTAENPVLFTANGTARWNGIEFKSGSSGSVKDAVVEHTNHVGVRIQNASPTIEYTTIWDVLSLSATQPARGVHVVGNAAQPIIRHCWIQEIRGANGTIGSTGPVGPNGPNGANGTVFSINGQPGGNGTIGGTGGAGTPGGSAAGIEAEQGASPVIQNNIIRRIFGGRGGNGGTGGKGGNGGKGGGGYTEVGFLGTGGAGGHGGKGGLGGLAGEGGPAYAVRLLSLSSNITVVQNLITELIAGAGGQGGQGGLGGNGGAGGPGVCVSLVPAWSTNGGNGGNGGAGGNGRIGGTGGIPRALAAAAGGATIDFVQNTSAVMVPGFGGLAGNAGFGGFGGLGGGACPNASPGSNGSTGPLGSAGSGGPQGTRHGVLADSVSINIRNSVFNFLSGPASGVQMVTAGTGSITAGNNCFFGFSNLSQGAVTVLAGNLLTDPLLVNPATNDFHLMPSSPAIDTGNNAFVPAQVLVDLDGNPRIVDGDSNASAIVDMGCFEVQAPIVVCQADIAPQGGDGLVNISDLLAVITGWGACPAPCPPQCPADIVNDCTVNINDLLAVINAWGMCP